jgi:aldose 1-epimerase
MSTNPLHQPILLRAGDVEVAVDPEHGGRLASWRIGGRELLLGPPAPIDGSIRWGSFLMAPWAGRLANGRFEWGGRDWQVRRNHGRHAIHGLAFDAPWRVDDLGQTTVELSVELAGLGWPFRGSVHQRIALAPERLELEASVHADGPMPAAVGWHPWFSRDGGDPALRIDAEEVLELRRMLPTGERRTVRGPTDLRAGPRLGRRRLDDVYVNPSSPARISWPDLDLVLEFDPQVSAVVVHTPPRGFCVEPQTAWPNAFTRDLARGESLATRVTWRWFATGTQSD